MPHHTVYGPATGETNPGGIVHVRYTRREAQNHRVVHVLIFSFMNCPGGAQVRTLGTFYERHLVSFEKVLGHPGNGFRSMLLLRDWFVSPIYQLISFKHFV